MNPASPWAPCGDGCLELVEDWPGGGDGGPGAARFGDAFGAARGGLRYLGYGRNYGVHGYSPFELQIVRLPDNVVTFDAYMPDGLDTNPQCILYLEALDTHRALGRLRVHGSTPTEDTELIYAMAPDAAPRVVRWGSFPWAAETVLTSSLWAVVPEALAWIAWHDYERSDQMTPLWTSPDGRWAHELAAYDSSVFFSTLFPGAMYQIEVAEPDAGSRLLRAFPEAAEGGACCARTDGTSLVWLEGSGSFDAPTRSYAEVRMMRSTYATTAEALGPETVRLLTLQNTVDGANMIMGAGYVLHLEVRNVGGTLQKTLALTRAATGSYWIIEPSPGREWTQLVYVDAEEFAVTDQGGTLGEARLVRRSVASLGKPMPPKWTP
ncbi:MAG: hypothetical protein HY908_18040 [Myxococcales bacterium]|nr:hypothetical protein [Myxococcales bacterium]